MNLAKWCTSLYQDQGLYQDQDNMSVIPRDYDYVAKYVDKLIDTLAVKKITFVTSRSKLIEQLQIFEGKQMTELKTRFRREIQREDGSTYIYEHPNPIRIHSALNRDHTILPDDLKKKKQDAFNVIHHPRGVDTCGDTETIRTKALFEEACPDIANQFEFEETTRGTLTDMIMTSKIDPTISFGLQIATAQSNGTFYFNKTVAEILNCFDKNLVVLFIGVVNGEIAGVYMIPPTQDAKDTFGKFAGSKQVAPSMLSKSKTSAQLNKYMENFRYIHTKFQGTVPLRVQGTFKGLDAFSAEFLELHNNYPHIVNTPEYLSSLFVDASRLTEWICNVSFAIHVAHPDILNITEKTIHGERGDKFLNFGEYQLKDERKILGVVDKTISVNGWKLPLRKQGHEGLNPLKVNVITFFIRSDRDLICPDKPEQIIGFGLLPVITANGDLALCPNRPESLHLSMTFDASKCEEWVLITPDRIGNNTYPENMQIVAGTTSKPKTSIKAIFYYKDLQPGSARLNELRELYKLFANREPSKDAIRAYQSAVNSKLIDGEKATKKKNNT